jgi:hypothetical protein
MAPTPPPSPPRDKRSWFQRGLEGLLGHVVALWGERYDPAKHYMRGPGPKTLRRPDDNCKPLK